MKKHVSKIMIVFSIIFLIAVIITLIPLGFGDTVDTFRLTLYFALTGLFLGLYRIIDLLEKK